MPITRILMRSLRLGWRRRHLCTHAFAESDLLPALQRLEALLPDGDERAKSIVWIRSSLLKEQEMVRQLLAEKEARIAEIKEHRDAQVQALRALGASKDQALNQLIQSINEGLKPKDEILNQLMDSVKLQEENAARNLIELLNVKRNNDTCGLFQRFQDQLQASLPLDCVNLKGQKLWKRILKWNASLAACVSRHSITSVNDTEKLADICYEIYTKLLEHVHTGGTLKQLQVEGGGTIKFHRGPLTAQQGEILGCIGKECGYVLEERDDM